MIIDSIVKLSFEGRLANPSAFQRGCERGFSPQFSSAIDFKGCFLYDG
jgi:hypothetical protein